MESNGVPQNNTPQINTNLLRFIYAIYPAALRLREGVARITVAPEEWARLTALKGKRAMLLCNHPSWHDPPVVFGLSRLLNEPFYYVAMEELFTDFTGKIVRNVGVFPIRRGRPDRKALKICQNILTERNAKLVFFPEGEATERNDVRLPIGEGGDGAAQIGFWAASALTEKAEKGEIADAAMPFLVLSVFYRCLGNAASLLERGVAHVEKYAGLISNSAPLDERLRKAESFALNGLEQELNLDILKDISDDERLTRLRERIEEKTCAALNALPPAATDAHLRIRALYSLIYDYRSAPILLVGESDDNTEPGRRIREARRRQADAIYREVERVQRFAVGGLDAPGEGGSPERLAERLRRLEAELFGRVRTHFVYEANIRIAKPFDLTEMLPLYKTARREAIRQATARTEEIMDNFLRQWQDRETPHPA